MVKKGEKITDPVQLERLAEMRKKAVIARQEKAKLNAMARENAKLEKAKREQDTIDRLKEAKKNYELKKKEAVEPMKSDREAVEPPPEPTPAPPQVETVAPPPPEIVFQDRIVYQPRELTKKEAKQRIKDLENQEKSDLVEKLFTKMYG
jgi:hypothetical protein